MRIGTLCANRNLISHGTIRGGSFLSAKNVSYCFISAIIFSSAFPFPFI